MYQQNNIFSMLPAYRRNHQTIIYLVVSHVVLHSSASSSAPHPAAGVASTFSADAVSELFYDSSDESGVGRRRVGTDSMSVQSVKPYDSIEEARRPAYPPNDVPTFPRTRGHYLRQNINCDGVYGDFWRELRRNITMVLYDDAEENLLNEAHWIHTSGPEMSTCPLGAVLQRFVQRNLDAFEGQDSIQWELEVLLRDIPISVWLRSEWGGLIVAFAAKFSHIICNAAWEYCQDESELRGQRARQTMDRLSFYVGGDDAIRYVNNTLAEFQQQPSGAVDSEAMMGAFNLAICVILTNANADGFGDINNDFSGLTTRAWRVIDMVTNLYFRSVWNDFPSSGNPLFLNLMQQLVLLIHIASFSSVTKALHPVDLDFHRADKNLNDENPEDQLLQPPAAFSPSEARERGDYEYLPIRACGPSNMITDLSFDYDAVIFAASVHKNRAVDELKKNLINISGTYVSPGSGCVVKKHSVGYVELVFGCLS